MPPKASLLGPGSLKLGETGSPREWAAQLTKTTLTPSTNEEDSIPVLSGEEIEGDFTETWKLGGTIQQDYDAASLELFCFANSGVWMPFLFVPNTASGISWAGECRVTSVVIGGDVKKRNTSDFDFTARDVAPVAAGA